MKDIMSLFPYKFNDKQEAKDKEIVKSFFPIFVKKYAKELNKFVFGTAGTALTIFRDGYLDDSDIDMGIFRKDLGKLWNFITKHNFKLGTFYVTNNKLNEIKVKIGPIYVDFFIYDIADNGDILSSSVWLKGIRSKAHLVILNRSFNINKEKFQTIKKCGIMVPKNTSYYSCLYGKNWSTKISSRDYINTKEYSDSKYNVYISKNIDLSQNFGIKNNKNKRKCISNEIMQLSSVR